MLVGERVRLVPVAAEDKPRLREINAEPSVVRWWGPGEVDNLGPDDDEVRFTIWLGEEIAGMIEYSEVADPRYRSANVDIFVATELQRQGIGSEAIRVICRHLFDDRGHHRLTIDPAVDNEGAIRCYEGVGFRAVGVQRRCELDPASGEWVDGLLMDMLAGELTGGRDAPRERP